MDNAIVSILSGGGSGVLLVVLLRGWISERLKQSIRHEYSEKLADHKAELDTRIQAIQHDNQLRQLRTSLFFDHQRDAFASLLSKIAEVNQKWFDQCFEENEGLTGPVPYEDYQELCRVYYQHQLFLDNPCLSAIDLLIECYKESFPPDVNCNQVKIRDVARAYNRIEYLQPRIAALFQNELGVSRNNAAMREIALFGAIRLVNHYHFEEIGLPVKGSLTLSDTDSPADAVARAAEHIDELLAKLRDLQTFVQRGGGGIFQVACTRATRYVEMLDVAKQMSE